VQNLYKCKSYARTPVQKLEISPSPPWILYHGGVARVKKKLLRGCRKFWEDLRRFLRFCEELTRSVDISRPAPANSLALIYSANLKKHIDSIDYALYNIVMKLRNRLHKFKVKHRLYCASDVWRRYDILITMVGFWALVLTLLALEAKGII